MNRHPLHLRTTTPWLLWGAALALALLAAYVHLLTSAVERAAAQRPAGSGSPGTPPGQAQALPAPIPDSHLAFIVVP
ncbi:hypothetical protein [Rubrivivax gelatinosus]|uniref:Uncharacterized protein n=1 Tax=Rubrivivax gelatinosus TaxID=28068 RepID=A0A4R2MH61_RUBGE|nr:hypothetical protein [Rubrivivax gelatinosus]MBK1690477.1 hypothetical protein [Rubrivivax gelatinosus]TCP04645.1 hypothetical protein EV684_102406 [Rubrivivax gelatinosus]